VQPHLTRRRRGGAMEEQRGPVMEKSMATAGIEKAIRAPRTSGTRWCGWGRAARRESDSKDRAAWRESEGDGVRRGRRREMGGTEGGD
jgi:hypothetical protein